MRRVYLLGLALLLKTGVVFIPSNAGAQGWSYGIGDGTFSYDWNNIGLVGQGDTVVVRRVVISTGDEPVAIGVQVCGIELVSSAAVRPVSEECSDARELLEPGDSIWAEYRWVVESRPGSYEYEIRSLARSEYPVRTSSTGTWEVQVSERRRNEVRPPNRLPTIIHAAIAEGDTARMKREVEAVVGHVVRGAGYFPVLIAPAAAGPMEGLARRLELTVQLGPDNRFSFGACWFDRNGSPMRRGCELTKSGGASSLMLGVILRDFVHREMEWVSRRTD